MKIFFIAGADSIHSIKWMNYFADRGHAVYCVSFTPPLQNIANSITVYYIKGLGHRNSPLNLLHYILKIKKLLADIKPDILHAHYAGTNGFIAAATNFHPFILTAWGSDVLITAKSKIKGLFVKYALTKADLITCDASHMVESIKSLDINSKKIAIIYFGIDTEKFKHYEADKQLKEKFDINLCNSIISLRSLEPIYDIETLIRAIPLVLKKFPNAKFIIAGKGSQENALKQISNTLKISDNIRFIGFIPNNQLPKYISLADIYVSTSLSDAGISASTAEAMSCSIPVIITDSGENTRWVKDGVNGYIVPVKSPDVLSEKIITLLERPELRSKLGSESRKTIVDNNNYYVEMAKMEAIYKNLITKQ